MSLRPLALAAACALTFTAAALAQGPPGPPGMFPPCLPEPGGACVPPGDMPVFGEGEMPDFGELPEGFEPPIACGGEVEEGAEPRQFDEELPPDGEFPGFPGDLPPMGCIPMEMDDLTPSFKPGFLKKAWRFDAEANSFDAEAGVLDVTITKIKGLPKRFRDQDDGLVDAFAYVLVGARTKVRGGALADADEVQVVGKLLRPDKWHDDEDDEAVPTIRAKRIRVAG